VTIAQKNFCKFPLSALFAVAVLTGCAVGTDFKRPDAPKMEKYSAANLPSATVVAPVPLGEAQHFNAAADIPHDWWTLFQSPQLNALIERAIKNNPNIESAQAALRQAQEYANAQQGFFYPTVGASYTPSRNKLAGNMGANAPGMQGNGRNLQAYSNPAGPVFNAPTYYNFHVAQLSVGYAPDVFGLNRRMMESVQAQVMLQQIQLEAAYLTLASNVVAAALQEASIRAQLSAMEKVVSSNQEMLDILNKQFKLGYVSEMEVAAQESALAFSQQSVIPLKKQLEQTRNLLRNLAGQAPNETLAEQFELANLHLPKELPVSLPSKLVEQRPDVRAAEAQLRYASAEAGVAVANRLPQFALAAGIGGMATTPDWMFRHGGGFFNLAANVSATIFDGGTLKARSRAAEQAALQAGAQYRSTVMMALQDVADTLYTIQSDAEALNAAAKSSKAAQHALELTRKQYQLGLVSYQTQLTADQTYQLSTINLIQAQTNRLGDTAALYQALGGGWWNRPNSDENLAVLSVSGETTR
jgi:NodT family efflux transporter outer membrane factor (OMF) lipoprotein